MVQEVELIAICENSLACGKEYGSKKSCRIVITSYSIHYTKLYETGMRPGDTLDVYGSGDVITGRYGEKFIIPGPKVGEIRISEVYGGKAVAAPLVDRNNFV